MFNQATAAEYFSVSLAEATEHLYARDRQKGRHFCAFDRPLKPCKDRKYVG